ncbi:energy transducer TonB [Cellvibrio sp.]|uniref:energy transducer TonB n=1 Tax=Cellvibrio sp. TaxID=1965322 RepID=UPI003964884E
MSYHVKKSAGQRSTGLIIVVVFHVLLIWGLAAGLDREVVKNAIEILKADVKEEEIVKEELPPPPPPEVKPPPPDFVPPPSLDFVPDAPAPAAIQNVQRTEKKVEAPVNQTKAKVGPKGLSKPEYPAASIRLGEAGTTCLNLYIGEDGKVQDAQISCSSGSTRLDEAAQKHAIRSWKFIPCMVGDKPVACWNPIKFTWRIEDAKN